MNIKRSKKGLAMACVLAGAAGLWLYSQASSPATQKKTALPKVSLVAATSQTLPLTFSTQGHLVSLNEVDIRAQITSPVSQVAFHEGDFVKQGQLLFVLDDAEEQAALGHAQAQLGVIKAELDKAERDLSRGQPLLKTHYISSSDWDALVSAQQQAAAQYKSAQDDIHTAQAQLAYTRIYAPVSGKTGALNVHIGSLAQPGSTLPMVSINQFDPIGAEFTLPEQDLNAVVAAQHQGPVEVQVTDASGKPVTGTLSFIDNTVSQDSGTVNFKARFANGENQLWPGAYQNITVSAGSTPNVVVLPPQAVQDGPDGHFVYVIDAQMHATTQPVTLLRIQQQMAVVSGIQPGMKVVLEGANALRPGMSVKVVNAPARSSS
ncbi:efflux RND transporter periplasmic adaptor subunit [Cedecea neteri]|uniref:efflux RND transporter periplasmic adaptor subunit n=1 Tax=Cedecea neteri TaxID=158822 RepID=UPI002892AC5B|nr:efflux RND transporter periplasmic adaptor subunit [Cedecea neteri]WNJ81882.1 efflux RND transporter periplasmic adaptor subunit [Cedecea neteri]